MGLGCRQLSGRGGFTLLELLLVVTVLSAVAWMSLGVVSNNADQVRFEDTRNRLQAIRRAIIGDTSRTVNGGPEVRGYVADMGRFPPRLQALVSQNYCADLPQYTTSSACTSHSGTWMTQNDYAYDESTGLWAGWNGPYLAVDKLVSGESPRFVDGWGNDDDTGDFGWTYTIYTESGLMHLLVQSLGRDGVVSGNTTYTNYEDDYPAAASPPLASQRLISEREYRVKITESGTVAAGDASDGLRVDFGAPASCWEGGKCSNPVHKKREDCDPAALETWTWRSGTCSNSAYTNVTDCENNEEEWTWFRPIPDVIEDDCNGFEGGYWRPNQDLCMAITRVSNGSLVRLDSARINITWDGTSKVEEFLFEDAIGPDFDEDTYIYQGQIAYGIFEYDSAATPACQITKPFLAGSATWKNFTYVPGTTLQPFERKINP